MVELRVGWPVLGTVAPPAPSELVVCPAGRAVVHTYVGDFINDPSEHVTRLVWALESKEE